MATYTVDSDASLAAALTAAGEGDTVLLATGRYAPVRIANKTGIDFASVDPTRPAVLSGLNVRDSKDLSFAGLKFDGTGQASGFIVWVERTAGISFDRVTVHGSLNGNPHDDTHGVYVQHSSAVSVTNSRFTELFTGIQHGWNDKVTIEGNTFDVIRMDGVRGSGSSQVRIVGNLFTDFFPKPEDHMDAIQFWTTGTTQAVTDIYVAYNLILRGRGAPVQGVFMRDEVGYLPFRNVVVERNFVSGGHYHGVSVTGAVDAVVTGNVVAGWPDQQSWLMLDAGTYRTGGNVATGYLRNWTDRSVPVGDAQVGASWDGGAALLAGWSAALPANRAYTTTLLAAAANPRFPTYTVNGTTGADTLSGAWNVDTYLNGGDGADYLIGHTPTTVMAGGAGDDRYLVRDLNDYVFEAANAGVDTVTTLVDYVMPENVENLILSGSARVATGNGLSNVMTGGALNDSLSGGSGWDNVRGGAGADTLDGGDGNDELRGGDGDDSLRGGTENDLVAGENGADLLYGQNGNDSLDGGAGSDRLWGGAGADVFLFRGSDLVGAVERIEDFKTSEGDKISLNMVDANAHLAGDQAFVFIGTLAFSGKAGELRYEAGSGGLRVFGDMNGDRIADLEIVVAGGAIGLAATDFWL